MISLWLIAAGVIFVVILFKFKEVRHKLGMMFVIILLLFLVASFGSLYATNNLDLTSFEGIVQAVKVYFSWLGTVFGNLGKISGYAIKQNWDINTTIVAGK